MLFGLLLAGALASQNLKFFVPQNPARVDEIVRMLSPKPELTFPSPADRSAWDRIAAHAGAAKIIKKAERLLGKDIPYWGEEEYLTFSKTGERKPYEDYYFARISNLSELTCAECLEYKGRFLDEIRRYLKVLLEEKVWVDSAHDRSLRHWNFGEPNVDLFASERGWLVALTVRLLQGRIGEDLERRALETVRARVIDPYLTVARAPRHPQGNFWWIFNIYNWNRVCHSACCAAALLTCDDPRERAEAIEFAERGLPAYLSGLGPDGYCGEGMGYWNYGFGHHLLLGLNVRRTTKGKVDFFTGEVNLKASQFPLGYVLDESMQVPTFADSSGKPGGWLMHFCSRIWPGHYPESWVTRDYFEIDHRTTRPAMSPFLLLAFDETMTAKPVNAPEGLPIRSWFPHAGMLISRCPKAGFSVAMKPLNEGWSHAHADAGSYVVQIDGEIVSGDPGGIRYMAATFDHRRWSFKVLNSYGHPVPLVNGALQNHTGEMKGKVLDTSFTDERDTLVVDLKSAYRDATNLVSIVRTFVFDRVNQTFTVKDDVKFSKPSSLEVPYVSVAPDKLKGHVTVDARGGKWEKAFEKIPNPGRQDVFRYAVRFTEPVREATVTFVFSKKPQK